MLRKAHGLIGTRLHALDGDLGEIDDFYFDDLTWTVRYMIVRAGGWFAEKHVMLSPSAITDVVWDERTVYVNLTQAQIKESPDLDLQKPVTREQELELVKHFRWPSYWDGPTTSVLGNAATRADVAITGIPAAGVFPLGATSDAHASSVSEHIAHDIHSTGISDTERLHDDIANTPERKVDAELERAANATGLHHYLRGVKELTGYHIAATDGEIGRVADFFMDEENWQIEYLLVDTGNWLSERTVLISTEWITDIVWGDSQVHVKATRQQVKSSPEYDPHSAIDRSYRGQLHTHYGFPPKWS